MEYTHKFHRGDSYTFCFNLYDESGNIIDLTQAGHKLYFTVKNNFEKNDFLFQKTLGDGIKFENDLVLISIEPEDTEELDYNLDPRICL